MNANKPSRFVILVDHATNNVPAEINNGCLGLDSKDMERHIAYDIGILGTSHALADALECPVINSEFSRLVVDPNRGEDDPTVLMQLYDGTIIPANRNADPDERQRRISKYHRPYRDAARDLIEVTKPRVIISMHSFTPQLNGRPKRPWEIGVLFAHDTRFSDPFIEQLKSKTDFTIGINEPYTGALVGDTMDELALRSGHLHALIEIRNDLIETKEQQVEWGRLLAPILSSTLDSFDSEGN